MDDARDAANADAQADYEKRVMDLARERAAECLVPALTEALPLVLQGFPEHQQPWPFTRRVGELLGMQVTSADLADGLDYLVEDARRERGRVWPEGHERAGEPVYESDKSFFREYPFDRPALASSLAGDMTRADMEEMGLWEEAEGRLRDDAAEAETDSELRRFYHGPRR